MKRTPKKATPKTAKKATPKTFKKATTKAAVKRPKKAAKDAKAAKPVAKPYLSGAEVLVMGMAIHEAVQHRLWAAPNTRIDRVMAFLRDDVIWLRGQVAHLTAKLEELQNPLFVWMAAEDDRTAACCATPHAEASALRQGGVLSHGLDAVTSDVVLDYKMEPVSMPKPLRLTTTQENLLVRAHTPGVRGTEVAEPPFSDLQGLVNMGLLSSWESTVSATGPFRWSFQLSPRGVEVAKEIVKSREAAAREANKPKVGEIIRRNLNDVHGTVRCVVGYVPGGLRTVTPTGQVRLYMLRVEGAHWVRIPAEQQPAAALEFVKREFSCNGSRLTWAQEDALICLHHGTAPMRVWNYEVYRGLTAQGLIALASDAGSGRSVPTAAGRILADHIIWRRGVIERALTKEHRSWLIVARLGVHILGKEYTASAVGDLVDWGLLNHIVTGTRPGDCTYTTTDEGNRVLDKIRQESVAKASCPAGEPVKVGEFVRYRQRGLARVVETNAIHGRVERPDGELWGFWHDHAGKLWDRIPPEGQNAAADEFELARAKYEVRVGDLREWRNGSRFVVLGFEDEDRCLARYLNGHPGHPRIRTVFVGSTLCQRNYKEPVKEAAKEPVKEAAKEPVKEAAKEPVKEAAKEPVKEPKQRPAVGEYVRNRGCKIERVVKHGADDPSLFFTEYEDGSSTSHQLEYEGKYWVRVSADAQTEVACQFERLPR